MIAEKNRAGNSSEAGLNWVQEQRKKCAWKDKESQIEQRKDIIGPNQ